MRAISALVFVLMVAACADPRATCLRQAGSGLQALDAEITEIEVALARGYRVAPGSRVTVGLGFCSENDPVTVCLGGERPVSERRIPIDPVAERARLRTLLAQRPEVEARALRAAAACPAP